VVFILRDVNNNHNKNLECQLNGNENEKKIYIIADYLLSAMPVRLQVCLAT